MSCLKCDCSHPYQDERYGLGMRIHNTVKVNGGQEVFICTVCGNNKQYTFGGKTIETLKRKKK